jgi:phenylalanyl-tRNA synthetase beta chain
MKISYNWLSELVQLTLAPRELAERLTMAGLAVDSVEPVGDDHVLEFDLTSNRPDALSHFGIAREAAVVCNSRIIAAEPTLQESDTPVESVTSVRIDAPDLCPRFTARVVSGVKVGPSPEWLVERLERIGQRSVNNVADVTNYVMFEMGQPTHAFDLNLLHERRIIVRRPTPGEKLTTLDGFARDLTKENLVIADADRAVAIAGVMGGEETEINARTTDVLIESAYFNPQSIRKTSKAFGLDTEAAYRFSRGADFNAQLRASARVAELMVKVAGGRVLKGAINVYPAPLTSQPVGLRESRIEKLTGLQVSIERAGEILEMLGFTVEVDRADRSLRAVRPSFRVDVSREEDLVEEVARHVGYDKVATTLPAWSGEGRYLPGEHRRRNLKRALAAIGFNEAISFSFVNGDRDRGFRRFETVPVLTNPIDSNQTEMRGSILTGLLDAVQHNLNQGCRDVRLFEMGRVFESRGAEERPNERELLGLVMTGSIAPDDWRESRQADFYDLKGAIEVATSALHLTGFTIERASVEYLHPGQAAVLLREGEEVARFGRLHPRVASTYKFRQPVFVAEIEFGRLLGLEADQVRYSALPRLPSASRDVSALVPDRVSWGEIEQAVTQLGIPEVASVRVFDMYTGKGMPAGFHSLAFRVVYRAEGRTLTDEEVGAMDERVRGLLVERFGAELR